MANGFGYGYGYGYGYGGILGQLSRYIGETVTIFTTSGGMSGSGFTGVLVGVNPTFITLITGQGPAPACPLGNACGGFDGYAGYGNYGGYGGVYSVGSVTNIPLYMVASFTHNAI